MANIKEQNASLKARQTKLLKKSKDDLIEVILRKDKVERNQVNQISKLKGEINSLQSRIRGYISDNEGNEKIIEDLRKHQCFLEDRNNSLLGKINAKSIEIEEVTAKLNKIIVEKETKAKSWANLAITICIILTVSIIAYIFK